MSKIKLFVYDKQTNWKDCPTYTGDLINGKRNNVVGKCILDNGTIKFGEWKDNRQNGIGMITHKNGVILKGEMLNDTFHGIQWKKSLQENGKIIEFNEKKKDKRYLQQVLKAKDCND